MATQIKRTNSFPDTKGLDQEFNQFTKQLVHKNDVLLKNSITENIVFYASSTDGGVTDYKITISSNNGQIISLEAV